VVARRLRADRVASGAFAFLVVLIVVAALATPIGHLLGLPDPAQQDPAALDAFGLPTGPSGAHLLGVDPVGRDVLARTLQGAQASLEVAILATGIAVVVGVTLGLVAGFYRGVPDTVLSRGADVVLAFPVLLLGLGLAASCSGANGCAGGLLQPGAGLVVAIIACSTWTSVFRLVRGQALVLREREFVAAAAALGARGPTIMVREILPNLAAPILVYAALLIPTNVLFESALSFLGVGVQPPRASWGAMIADAVGTFDTAWWYLLFPGMALLLTVLAFNLLGNGLQDALDPRSAR
jgi:peptide/nickel transport system permease protein